MLCYDIQDIPFLIHLYVQEKKNHQEAIFLTISLFVCFALLKSIFLSLQRTFLGYFHDNLISCFYSKTFMCLLVMYWGVLWGLGQWGCTNNDILPLSVFAISSLLRTQPAKLKLKIDGRAQSLAHFLQSVNNKHGPIRYAAVSFLKYWYLRVKSYFTYTNYKIVRILKLQCQYLPHFFS